MRVAIVLFSLGGPDRPEAVRPFLFNLFSDPAILSVPQPLRWLLARLISTRRAPLARQIYAEMGGRSPLLENTEAQARALESALTGVGEARAFVAMRYWHPFADETAALVAAYRPDRIVLLPLYPQYSTTTSRSSLRDWHRAARRIGLDAPTNAVCCYPTEAGFIEALVEQVGAALAEAGRDGHPVRVLFSAHGLPEKVIAAGDPYQDQVRRTAAAVAERLGFGPEGDDWRVTYQSRVGPLKWIEPYTDEEIGRAGGEGRALVVVPVAFVSEHSETLVELDIEYRKLAEEKGVPVYVRVPAVAEHPSFVGGLAGLVRRALAWDGEASSETGGRLCPLTFSGCYQETP